MNYFDLHCDTLFSIACDGGTLLRREGHIDLQRAQCFDQYAQVFALYCGEQPLNDAERAHRLFRRLLDTAQEQFRSAAGQLMHCCTAVSVTVRNLNAGGGFGGSGTAGKSGGVSLD